MSEVVELKKPNGKGNVPVLMPERFGLAESKRQDFVVDVAMGVLVDEIVQPSYWSHVAGQLYAGDHIEARAEDFSWIAHLIVKFAEKNYAVVHLDRVIQLEKVDLNPVASAKHRVEWKGPMHRFCVIRVADSEKVQGGFKTRGEADDWMKNHEKAA